MGTASRTMWLGIVVMVLDSELPLRVREQYGRGILFRCNGIFSEYTPNFSKQMIILIFHTQLR